MDRQQIRCISNSDIYGALVNGLDNSVSMDPFIISDDASTADQVHPAVAITADTHKFLVVWETAETAIPRYSGQFVDGLTGTSGEGANFPVTSAYTADQDETYLEPIDGSGITNALTGTVTNTTTYQAQHTPSVTYNTVKSKFMVAWQESTDADYQYLYVTDVCTEFALFPEKYLRAATADNIMVRYAVLNRPQT